MTDIIACIAVSASCICVLQAFLWSRSAKKWKLERQKAQLDLVAWQGRAEEAERKLQTLLDNPPTPADPHFARHLSDLGDRIAGQILSLDDARLRSVDPLRWVAGEAEGARVISRKKRLTGYFETLCKTNVEINLHIERLIECHAAVATLCDLMRAEQLNMLATNSRCETIDGVIQALRLEESPDATWRKKIEGIRKEFEPIYRASVRKSELESAERQSARTAASRAFGQHQLPPMTPLEKFRLLKSHGQRDSFE